ncbi:MAG TPA: amino acid adenylation domain-containing protein, partial [Polyangiaceae bacterium]
AVEEPFDLEKGPLFRVSVFLLGPEESLLTLTAHHIVFDGYSTGILVTDWGHLYSARKTGSSPELKVAERFSDYARAEKSATESLGRLAHERYWVDKYPGEAPVLELPYDRPRPPMKTYASRRLDIELEPDLVRDIKKLGAKQGASLFATLLASFGVLMSRLSGQTSVVVGIPAAGQSVGDHDTLVGHCVNMLPFRGDYDLSLPLKELLSVTRRNVLDAYDHQEYTFGSLLKKLTIPRDPSRLPLVSVVFNMDRGLLSDALPFHGLSVDVRTNPRHFENFDLFVNAVDLRDRVILECQYNTDLFDERTIGRWFASYKRLLRSMVDAPDSCIGDLSLLAAEDATHLRAWNETNEKRTDHSTVPQMIEAQVDRTPNKIAVRYENQTITYRELDRRANQLARRLVDIGVRRDVLVGICLERSIEMMIALLAVHKAGGGYVPLDPGYPRDRLAYMVEDSAMPVLITDSRLLADFGLAAKHVVCLDEEALSLSELSGERLIEYKGAATSESLAYVIYTSGSTGKPKGVLIEHGSVVNLLASLHVVPGFTERDIVLAITTLSFDIAVSELILPLTAGAEIVLVSRDVASDGSRLMQTIAETSVTFIDATPATYRLLLAAGWGGDRRLRVICTGEAMPKDLAIDLVPRVGELWNGYGPTETTVWSTFYSVQAPIGRILIGRPVDNTQIYILDARGNEVPIGVTGEMFIGGQGVARGYLNRPDLTAERFISDPFSNAPKARMYKTGDLARYLPDGNIECLGRNDNQVKLRGFRIELGEIENALATHARVTGAAVIVREDRPGDRRLCAYFVASGEVSESELRAHLKVTLPDYMVPQHFTALERMPLTPSGKTDRKALPAPSGEARLSENFVEPETKSERLIADLWKQALVVSRVSANDDFFALGGHSLLASQILARLRVEHGIVVPFRKMFEAPTIRAFARLVDEISEGAGPTVLTSIPKLTNTDRAQLSLSQERLWSLDEMDPNSWRPHVLPAAWRLKGALDVPTLKLALQYLVDRHPILRTSFHLVDGRPIQRVAPTGSIELKELDFSSVPDAALELKLAETFDEDAEVPYDLSVAPLLRSILIKISDKEHVLYSSRHNIIWDGWSFDLYLRDLSAAYAAIRDGKPPQLPVLPVDYADFAAWHREWLRGPEHEKQLAYWRKQLDTGFAPLALPTDRTAPKARAHYGANAMVNLSLTEAEQLTALAHDSGATLYTVLLSAFAALLHRYTGQTEFLVGTPVRARTRPETEDIIGPFVNTLALKFRVDSQASFLNLVTQARDTTLDAFSHQESPLEALGAKAPAVRINFSLQDARTRPTTFGDLEIAQQHVMHRSAVNDLTLWAMYSTKTLLVVLNYSTELFNESTIRYFLDAYRTLVTSIISNPHGRLRELNVNSKLALELAKAAGESNGFDTSGTTFSQLVQKQAQVQRLAPAFLGGSESNYGQLCAAIRAAIETLRGEAVSRDSHLLVLGARNAASVVLSIAGIELGAKVIVADPETPIARFGAILAKVPGLFVCADSTRRSHVFGSFPDARILELETFAPTNGSADSLQACGTGGDETVLRSFYFKDDGDLGLWDTTYAELLATTIDVASRLKLESTDRVAALDDCGTTSWLIETLAALAAGGAVLLVDEAQAERRAIDGDWLQSLAPNVVMGHSDLLPSLCSHTNWTAPVRTIVSTGYPVAGPSLDRLRTRADRAYQAFSFHEGSVWQTLGAIDEATARLRIGSALGATCLSLFDADGYVVPVGVVGRVHIARGKSSEFETTAYRARLLGNGSYELQPPESRNAWVRGRRILVSVLERCLVQHPAIADAATILIARNNDTPVLVGYVVAKPGCSFTETELRKFLRLRLPEWLVPQDFVEVQEIPRDATDAPILERLPSSYVGVTKKYIAPRDEAERLLVEVWQSVLKIDRISVDDNFFNIGGHSLLCFQVIDDVMRRTTIRLSPRSLLLDTLEQVAKSIQAGPVPPPTASADDSKDGSFGGRLFGKLRKIAGV